MISGLHRKRRRLIIFCTKDRTQTRLAMEYCWIWCDGCLVDGQNAAKTATKKKKPIPMSKWFIYGSTQEKHSETNLGKILGLMRIAIDQQKRWIDRISPTCPIFGSIWKVICSVLGVLHPRPSLEYLCTDWTKCNFTKCARCIILMLLLAIARPCWKERNARVFLNKHKYEAQLC